MLRTDYCLQSRDDDHDQSEPTASSLQIHQVVCSLNPVELSSIQLDSSSKLLTWPLRAIEYKLHPGHIAPAI